LGYLLKAHENVSGKVSAWGWSMAHCSLRTVCRTNIDQLKVKVSELLNVWQLNVWYLCVRTAWHVVVRRVRESNKM